MKHLYKVIAVLFLLLLTGCSERHLITDAAYRKVVDSCYAKTLNLVGNRISNYSERNLTQQQQEALKFLYAFMPLNDIADYSPEFYIENINVSLRAKNDFQWGKSIPEDIFLHYVLPVRVNNENLDSFRIRYYDEISSRVKNRSIVDAALEINHWCHEKVTYQPSDSRTSAPMSTILSARGRCGEESTFTVAALRTAGIPARQVYTPRWAHCDDNHAWVEFWNNGQWSYMGACEPEPVPDRGWFTEPARRAMLVNTRSFGAPSDNENIIATYDRYSIVNNLQKYAVTKRIFVRVTGSDGKPVKDAVVDFGLYNYAEFYPIASVPTNAFGICSLETGLGDLLIWGSKGNEYDFRKISVSGTDTLNLKLAGNYPGENKYDLDLSVPVKRTPGPGIAAELAEENSRRFNEENSIRKNYTDSWTGRQEEKEFAIQHNQDSSKVVSLIEKSMGNYKAVYLFLGSAPDSLREKAIAMLEVIAEKDLRDTKCNILLDHLMNCRQCSGNADNKIFTEYILNPRISNEILSAWRSYLQEKLPAGLRQAASKDPSVIIDYLNYNLKIDDNLNYGKTSLTPKGVIELGISDSRSRAICFVAIERSLGIASRLEPGSNLPQYYLNSKWNDVYFADQTKLSDKRGFLKLNSSEKNPLPVYYKNFTIARFDKGRYNTLEYQEDKPANTFGELSLIPGKYMLVTGNRLDDSRILASLSFFDISEGEHKVVEIKLRHDNTLQETAGKAEKNY